MIGRRSSIDARIQVTAAINGRAITRPRTRSRGKTTARHEGWRRWASVSWAAPRPSPEVVRRPMPGRPICTAEPPATATGAMRGISPLKGGYHAPRRRWSLDPACQGAASHSDAPRMERARTAQRRTAHEVAQRDAGDVVRQENVHRDRGGKAPPVQSVQSSKRAVARGRKKCVCVCVCVCCCCC